MSDLQMTPYSIFAAVCWSSNIESLSSVTLSYTIHDYSKIKACVCVCVFLTPLSQDIHKPHILNRYSIPYSMYSISNTRTERRYRRKRCKKDILAKHISGYTSQSLSMLCDNCTSWWSPPGIQFEIRKMEGARMQTKKKQLPSIFQNGFFSVHWWLYYPILVIQSTTYRHLNRKTWRFFIAFGALCNHVV